MSRCKCVFVFPYSRYEDGQVGDNNIDTQSEKYKKEILRAVSFQAV